MDVCLDAYLQHLLSMWFTFGWQLQQPFCLKFWDSFFFLKPAIAVGLNQISLFLDVYRCPEKKNYFRNHSKECHPKKKCEPNANVLSHPPFYFVKDHSDCKWNKNKNPQFYSVPTGNQSYAVPFSNLNNIHKSSVFIKSMLSHFLQGSTISGTDIKDFHHNDTHLFGEKLF